MKYKINEVKNIAESYNNLVEEIEEDDNIEIVKWYSKEILNWDIDHESLYFNDFNIENNSVFVRLEYYNCSDTDYVSVPLEIFYMNDQEKQDLKREHEEKRRKKEEEERRKKEEELRKEKIKIQNAEKELYLKLKKKYENELS